MQKTMEVYYENNLVNSIVYDMDYIANTAKIIHVECMDNKYEYIPKTGVDNIYSFIVQRAFLEQSDYFQNGVDGYTVFSAFNSLEKSKGLYYGDKYWFKLNDSNEKYEDVLKQMKNIKGYYGVQSKAFYDTICRYRKQGKTELASQILGYLFLKSIDMLPAVKIVDYDFDYSILDYERLAKNDGDKVYKSLFTVLLENYKYDSFANSEALPIMTFNKLVDMVSSCTNMKWFKQDFARILFLDAILLNDGHYLNNVYLYEDKEQGTYVVSPYTYTHVLGVNLECPLQEKAIKAKGCMICDSFDVQGQIVKPFLDFEFKDLVVPVGKLVDEIDYSTLTELCALLGYRYKIFTDKKIFFDETQC